MNSSSLHLSYESHEQFGDSPDSLISRAWRSLNSSSPGLDHLAIQYCREISAKDAIDFSKSLNPVFIVLDQMSDDLAVMTNTFNIEAIRSTLNDSNRDEFRLRNDLGLLGENERLREDSLLDILPFQDSLLRFGKLLINCPFCGEPRSSDQSFFVQAKGLMWNYILYRFAYGNDAYYLITGGVCGKKLGIYFPSKNLVITNAPSLENGFRHSLSVFCAKLLLNCSAFLEYLAYSQKKDMYLCLFYSKQFGHSILSDISGFYASLHMLLARQDLKYVIGDNLIMNPADIFNFIGSTKLLHEDCDEAFINSLLEKRLLIRVTRNNVISNDFESYIRGVSMSHIDNNVEQMLKGLDGKQIIIHYSLRTKRTWNDHVGGIIFTFMELLKAYPNSVLIIDGMTSLYGPDGKKIIRDCSEIELASLIQQALPRDASISIIGMSYPEKILIVSKADFSISPYGSGDIIANLLRIPMIRLSGIANHHSHMQSDIWLRYRPDLPIHPRVIVDSGPTQDSGNFSIDRQVLLDHCLKMARSVSRIPPPLASPQTPSNLPKSQ
jgi:hypothetical protein